MVWDITLERFGECSKNIHQDRLLFSLHSQTLRFLMLQNVLWRRFNIEVNIYWLHLLLTLCQSVLTIRSRLLPRNFRFFVINEKNKYDYSEHYVGLTNGNRSIKSKNNICYFPYGLAMGQIYITVDPRWSGHLGTRPRPDHKMAEPSGVNFKWKISMYSNIPVHKIILWRWSKQLNNNPSAELRSFVYNLA